MAETELKKWRTNSSKYIVNDRWLKLRADSYMTPDGHTIEPYYVFEYHDWINCFVVDTNLDVIMVRHYRPGVDEYIPELVSGGLEISDTSPEEGMKRELQEEVGYIGGEIYKTGICYANPANHTNKIYSFIAVGGSCSQPQQLEEGEDLQIMKIPLKSFLRMIQSPEVIYQSHHLTSIFFALNFIKKSEVASVKALRELV